MRLKLLENKQLSTTEFRSMIEKFLEIVKEVLEIDSLPRIKFRTEFIKTDNQPSFGMYVVGQQILYVSLINRHPIDILRTMAHELVHYKQDINDELDDLSGETGSDHENEANYKAGIIMRLFSQRYPQYMLLEPIQMK